MTKEELNALCNLLMVCDPWPTCERDLDLLHQYADRVSRDHGFTDWIDAYHRMGWIKASIDQQAIGA
jgi:hypothetical protein